MADDIELNAGTGGAIIRTDDDGAAHWQYVKVAFGADNTQTIVGSISSNPFPVALSATDNAVLDSIQTAVELIDNAVSGAGFNITQLNGAAVPIGAGVEATALRVTLATDSTGVVSIDDNGSSITVDGTVTANLSATDNAVLDSIDAAVNGTLTVGSHAVTNAGTFAVQVDGDALTALQLIDNIVLVEDAVHSTGASGIMPLAVRNDTLAALAGTDGDYAPLQVNASGALFIQEGAALDVSAATVTVTGTVTADLGATDNAVLDSIDSAVNGTLTVQISDTSFAVADGNALGEGVLIQGDDGTDRKNINVDATTGDVQVDVTNTVTVGSHDVTNAGTFAVQVDGSALTALQLMDNPIVAHDAAASGATGVNMAGGFATNSIEGLTQVAASDAARLITDLNGVLVTRPHTTLEEIISERITNTNGTSTNLSNFAAAGAGVHNYITTAIVNNSHASTSGTIDLRDGSAGSVIATLPAPADGGSVVQFPVPLKGAANTALAYDVSAAISTITLTLIGFQAQG